MGDLAPDGFDATIQILPRLVPLEIAERRSDDEMLDPVGRDREEAYDHEQDEDDPSIQGHARSGPSTHGRVFAYSKVDRDR